MVAVAMKIARMLGAYFVGFLLCLGAAIGLSGPGPVQASTEKSFYPSTPVQPENPLAPDLTPEQALQQESFGRLSLAGTEARSTKLFSYKRQ